MLGFSIFVASAAFVVYVLAGYPLLLAWMARRSSRAVYKDAQPRPVTLIMAVHNGEAWLRAKLESILELRYPRELLEILVVSDGSNDGTDAIAREFRARGVELLRIPRGGKALALNAGIARAGGEILFFTDVRQTLEPESLSRLVACFADPAVGAVSGELIVAGAGSAEEEHTGLYWRYEKSIRKELSRIDSILGATGCIYAMRAKLAERLPAGTLLDDMYLPLAAFFRGYRVVMEDSARAYDVPTMLEAEFRRKARTLAGVYQIIGAFPALLFPWSNRMWIHFVSHKLARLLLPFALIAAAISSFALPRPLDGIVVAAQAAFCGVAGMDRWVPEGSRAKRLSSSARTFVAMMAAAAWALSIVFRPSTSFWTTPTGAPSCASIEAPPRLE